MQGELRASEKKNGECSGFPYIRRFVYMIDSQLTF